MSYRSLREFVAKLESVGELVRVRIEAATSQTLRGVRERVPLAV